MDKNEQLIEKHLGEAERLMDGKLYDRAMIEFSKAMKINRKQASKAVKGIYERCMASGDYGGLIAVGSNLLSQVPDNIELANILGNAYRRMGNFPQATKLYEHALNADVKAELPAYNLAATLAHSNLFDQSVVSAISEFERMTSFKVLEDSEQEKKLMEIQRSFMPANSEPEEEAPKVSSEKGETTDNEADSEKTNTDQTADSPPEDQPSEPDKASSQSKQSPSSKKEATEATADPNWQKNLANEVEEVESPAKKQEAPKEIELEPMEIFKHMRRNMDLDAEETLILIRALGAYCLRHKQPDVAWRLFTRLSFAWPDDDNIQCFLALAYAMWKGENQAIDKLITLLGDHPYNRYANVNLGYLYQQQKEFLLSRKYFIISRELLEKSDGYYDLREYRALADRYYEEETFGAALKIYEVLLSERETIDLLRRVGDIRLKMEKYKEALEAFLRIKEIAPDSQETDEIFQQLNQLFLQQAESLTQENKFARVVEFLELSLSIERTISVIEKLMDGYKALRNEPKVQYYQKELYRLREDMRLQEQEKHRQSKINEGKNYVKHHNYHKAIRSYEEALRLKPDKEVFVKLLGLYKRTRQLDMISDLTMRYNKSVEREQQEAKYKQEMERQQRVALEDADA